MTVYVVHTVLRIYVLCQQAVMRQRNYWNEWDQNVNKEEQLDDDVVVGKSTWRKCVYNFEIFVNDYFTHWEKPQRCKSNADIKSPHSFPHVCISSEYDIPPTRTNNKSQLKQQQQIRRKKKQRIWYEIWGERKFKKETQEKYKNEFQWLSGDRISLKQTNRAYTLSIFKWFLIVVYTHSVT